MDKRGIKCVEDIEKGQKLSDLPPLDVRKYLFCQIDSHIHTFALMRPMICI